MHTESLNTIREHESLRLEAYICPTGHKTIGYGHTGPDVMLGQVITEEQAEQLLAHDTSIISRQLKCHVDVPLSDNQLSALTSFVYNVGMGAFKNSTLLKLLNLGRYEEVPEQLALWKWGTVEGKKVVLQGLVKRRAAEAALWLRG